MTIDGAEAAHWFKFLANKKAVPSRHEKFEYVSYSSLYKRKKLLFDKLAKAFASCCLDVIDYLKFCVEELSISEETVCKLSEQFTVQQYSDWIQIQLRRKKVYGWYMKSVKFVAEDCARHKICSTVDYLKHLISARKLASYFIAGKISKYFLAAIPKFPLIVQKMDRLSRDEFSYLCEMYDKYHTDIREAVIQETGTVPDVFSLTDSQIEQMSL